MQAAALVAAAALAQPAADLWLPVFGPFESSVRQQPEILTAMNTLRAQYGACPLEWSDELATAVTRVEQGAMPGSCIEEILRDTQRFYEPGKAVLAHHYGERGCDGCDEACFCEEYGTRFSVAKIFEFQVEVLLPTYDMLRGSNPAVLAAGKNWWPLLQILWKDATKVGCSFCISQRNSLTKWKQGVLTCSFDVPFVATEEAVRAQTGEKGESCDKCTGVTCDPNVPECVQPNPQCNPLNGQCEQLWKADGEACSTGTCFSGVCVAPDPCEKITCPEKTCQLSYCEGGECKYYAKGGPQDEFGSDLTCDDGNPRTVNDMCEAGTGKCIGEDLCAKRTEECPKAQSTCQLDSECDYMTGQCTPMQNVEDGSSCDDGMDTTIEDKCASGVCVGRDRCEGVTCEERPCREPGVCNSLTGTCEYATQPEGTPCDDKNVITTRDACNAGGVCVGVDLCANVTCTPQNACMESVCDVETGECLQIDMGSNDNPCDPCEKVVCDTPTNPCLLPGTCDEASSMCTAERPVPVGTPCDDGNAQTVEDACNANSVCVGVDKCANVTCVPQNACWESLGCDKQTGECNFKKLDDLAGSMPRSCDDGDADTVNEVCKNGVCVGEQRCNMEMCKTEVQCKRAACQMDNSCNTNLNKEDGTQCDDENPRTVNDKCRQGVCVGEDLCAGKTCPPLNGCYLEGQCDPLTGQCSIVFNDGASCDDGVNRTVEDTCTQGKCIGTDKCLGVQCPAENPPCEIRGKCDKNTGKCVKQFLDVGTPCDDQDITTRNSTCQITPEPKCQGVPKCDGVVCPEARRCYTQPKCDPRKGQCFSDPLPQGSACDDGDNTTRDDMCDGKGQCRGTPKCQGQVCKGGRCKSSVCEPTTGECAEKNINEGRVCSKSGSICAAGECVDLCVVNSVMCPAPTECQQSNICNPSTGECEVSLKEDGAVCNDGNPQTRGDVCGSGVCTGTDPCIGVTCEPLSQCHEAGECKPWVLNDGRNCTTPQKKDGTPCDDKDDSTFWDSCERGVCRGQTCGIIALETYGTTCVEGNAGLGEGQGGFGWSNTGLLYVDGGCRGLFRIRATGEEVRCGDGSADYIECAIETRLSSKLAEKCVPTVPPCKVCEAKDQCHDVGVCNKRTGRCTNPAKPDGSLCDDGNAATVHDQCESGVCVGKEVRNCFRASTWYPSRECAYDESACGWGSGTWATMEECCRPGNGHHKGCAPAPPTPEQCWRPAKWWPTRECVMDADACDWGLGEHVWESEEECCKAGNGFECGCLKPPKTKTCYEDAKGFPLRSCKEVIVTTNDPCDGETSNSGRYTSEEMCCLKEHGKNGCAMACKSLDVVLVLDGSGSMKKSFQKKYGYHPHGYYALMDMLRTWIKDLPLTGRKAGEKDEGEGVRVGIVQFSSRYGSGRYTYRGQVAVARKAAGWATTQGRLSGNTGELLKDVDFHQKNFFSFGTMVREGLELAVDMFEEVPRPRALIILSDGEIFDVPHTTSVRQKLNEKDVVVFGVVVRRYPSHSFVDDKAEETLRPLLSKPTHDHFFNLMIDEVPSKVLHGVCSPNSKWGSYIKPVTNGKPPKFTPVFDDPTLFQPVKGATLGVANIFFPGKEKKPFEDLDCAELHTEQCDGKPACEAVVDGSAVSINKGYIAVQDTLDCAVCRKLGLKTEFERTSGVLYIQGSASLEVHTQALSNVTFITQAKKCSEREFTFSYGNGFSAGDKKHIYRYFNHRGLTWKEAAEKCQSKKLLGMDGYLITVTSKAENDIAKSKLCGQGWMGGSDNMTEGEWRWVTGPEGCPNNKGGLCDVATERGQELTYENWENKEPNDYRKPCAGTCVRDGEDYMHYRWPSAEWNDYPFSHRKIHGYICEWGNDPPKPCTKNHVGTRTLTCSTDPTDPVDPKCKVKATKPVGKDGCASGWLALDDSIDRKWCNENCVDDNGRVKSQCKPGGEEKCACLPERVQQCRCSDDSLMMLPQYCASLKPDAQGLHDCTPVNEELQGDWDEQQVGSGEPPAIGDTDPAFKCHTYDADKKTFAESVGQCWSEATYDYFTRYLKETEDEEACKALCTSTPGCHAVSWSEGTRTCYVQGLPEGKCGPGTRTCTAPKTKPKTGTSFGCTVYKNGASPSSAFVCLKKEVDAKGKEQGVCTLPDMLGRCLASTKKRFRPTLSITVRVGGSMKGACGAVAGVTGVSTTRIVVKSLCPRQSCTMVNGRLSCGSTAASRAKCVTPKVLWWKKTGRQAQALAEEAFTEPMVMVVEADEPSMAAEVYAASERAANAPADDSLPMTPENEKLKLLRAGGIEGLAAPAQPVVEQGAAVVVPPEATTPKSDDGDDGSNTALIIGLSIGGVVLIAGIALVMMQKRQKSVTWSEVGMRADDSNANLDKQYEPMRDSAELAQQHNRPASQPGSVATNDDNVLL